MVEHRSAEQSFETSKGDDGGQQADKSAARGSASGHSLSSKPLAQRLREGACMYDYDERPLLLDAAKEIERLRAEVKWLQARNRLLDRLRAAFADPYMPLREKAEIMDEINAELRS